MMSCILILYILTVIYILYKGLIYILIQDLKISYSVRKETYLWVLSNSVSSLIQDRDLRRYYVFK